MSGSRLESAEGYADQARTDPEAVLDALAEVEKLLTTGAPGGDGTPDRATLETRAYAAAALERIADHDASALTDTVDDVARVLREENERTFARPEQTTEVAAISVDVRESCTEVLAAVAYQHPEAVAPHAELLEPGLRSEDQSLVSAAAGALSRIGIADPEAIASMTGRLTECLDATSHGTQLSAAVGIVAASDAEREVTSAVDRLASLCTGHSPELRQQALDALEFASKAAPQHVATTVGSVVELLEADAEPTRETAAGVLARVSDAAPERLVEPPETFVPYLDADVTVASAASMALSSISETDPDRLVPVREDLVDALRNGAPPVRMNVGIALVDVVRTRDDIDAPVAEPLAELLTTEIEGIRSTAASVLAGLSEGRPEIVARAVPRLTEQAVETTDPEARLQVLWAVENAVGVAPERVGANIGPLAGAVEEWGSRERAVVANIFAGVGSADADTLAPHADTLVPLLRSGNELESSSAVVALSTVAKHRPDVVVSVTESLGRVVRDADDDFRSHALNALHSVVRERPEAVAGAVPALPPAVRSDDPQVVRLALAVLRALAADQPSTVEPALDAVFGRLRADHEQIRHQAVEVVSIVAGETPEQCIDATAALVAVLDDSEARPETREAAAHALLGIANVAPAALREYVDTLGRVLTGSEEIAPLVANAMAGLGAEYPQAIEPYASDLAILIESDSRVGRLSAAAALSGIARHAPDTVAAETEALAAGLRAPDVETKRTVAQALAELSREHPEHAGEATEPLVALVTDTDEDEDVRRAALVALKGITTSVPKLVASPGEQVEAIGGNSSGGVPDVVAPYAERLAAVTAAEDRELRLGGLLLLSDIAVFEHDALLPALGDIVDAQRAAEDSLGDIGVASVLEGVGREYPEAVAEWADFAVSLLSNDDPRALVPVVGTLGHVARAQPAAVVEAVPRLGETLRMDEPLVQIPAADTLRVLAEADPEAVLPVADALTHLLTSSLPTGRLVAADCLESLAEASPSALAPFAEGLLTGTKTHPIVFEEVPGSTIGEFDAEFIDTELKDRYGMEEFTTEDIVYETRRRATEALSSVLEATPGAVEVDTETLVWLLDEHDRTAIEAPVAELMAVLARERPESVREQRAILRELLTRDSRCRVAAMDALSRLGSVATVGDVAVPPALPDDRFGG